MTAHVILRAWFFSIVILKITTAYVGHDRPELRDLSIHVVPNVADRWYKFGQVLLEPKYASRLKTIRADAKNDAEAGCAKMFEKWLDTDKLASWNKVIEALKSVELISVASDIKNLLEQGEWRMKGTFIMLILG